jgi:hypothetical protein
MNSTITKRAADLRPEDVLVRPQSRDAVYGEIVDFGDGDVGIYFRHNFAIVLYGDDPVQVEASK